MPGCSWLRKNQTCVSHFKFSQENLPSIAITGAIADPEPRSSSIVIKCMQDRDLTPTAFFYCARSSAEPARAKPIEILCSLLRQLCNCRRELLVKGSIVDYYENHKEEAEKDGFALKRLSLEDCTRMITEFTKKYSATLIVDALDECDEDMRHELLEAFDNILSSSMNNVRIFVSSREDIDIVGIFPRQERGESTNDIVKNIFILRMKH